MIGRLAQCTYAIFIFHGPFAIVLGNYISPDDFTSYSLGVIMETTFVFLAGLLFGYVIR